MESNKLTNEEIMKINNNFVLLRKQVTVARIAMIRKLTKKVTAMRDKKSKKPEVNKKIETLVSQIMNMKAFKTGKQCDKLSLFAVKNTLDLQQILSDGKVDSRTKAMARLAFFKTVKNGIKKFKEENPKYLVWLKLKQETKSKKDKKKTDNSKSEGDGDNENEASKGKKIKKGKNKKRLAEDGKEVEVSEAKKVKNESKDDSEDEENNKDTENQGENDNGKSEGDDNNNNNGNENENENEASKVKKIRKGKNRKHKNRSVKNEKIVDDEVKQENNNDAEDEDDTNKNQDKHDSSIKKSITKSNKINKKKMTVKKTDDGKDNNNDDDDDDIGDKKRKDANKVKCKRVIDPFFVSDDNNPVYLDIPEVEDDEEKEEEEERDSIRGKMGRNDFGKGRRNDKFNNNGENKFSRDRNQFSNDKNKFNKRKINETSYGNKSIGFKKGMVGSKQDNNDNNAELHPSWAARKKQQDVLKQGFQGKKIVFNDDD